MLLIPLVENVFKHGIDKSKANNHVQISATISDKLVFEVTNTMAYNHNGKFNGNGTGLRNLTDRLHILYQNNYTFESSKSGDLYISKLNIPIL
jgi:LytS/YehU family sensor histidine kinase